MSMRISFSLLSDITNYWGMHNTVFCIVFKDPCELGTLKSVHEKCKGKTLPFCTSLSCKSTLNLAKIPLRRLRITEL